MTILETSSNGQFNVTEYGSIKNPEQAKALLAYSPYQHIVDGKHYPVALFMTGDNDSRVDPAHSRKFVARLQGAGATAYLRTSANAGHGGIGAAESERVAWAADSWAFFFDQLGVKW
jgi:prolyl oligopeptidase